MYAPKLQPLTREERWTLGFHHRIDRMADEALAEIREMAAKAMEGFKTPDPQPEQDEWLSHYVKLPPGGYVSAVHESVLWQRQLAQASAMQNVYPYGAYNFGASPLWGGLAQTRISY